jgi:GxxExxY protein
MSDIRSERDPLTEAVIGAAIEVHRFLGPGLLETSYRECLAHELQTRAISFRKEVPIPIRYKEIDLDCGYRLDLLVDEKLVVELKAVEKLLPIHEAQLLTYLRLGSYRIGLLINFNTARLVDGVRRRILG